MNPVIKLDDVVKRYNGVTALDKVNVALEPGRVIALVGHNGAGKTTLLKLVLGLIRPTSGMVRVLGVDPASTKAVTIRKRMGFLPETASFHGAMTGRELLSFYGGLKGVTIDQAMGVLSGLGLGDAAERRVGTYSKGMRQRLGMAQALLGDPEILLLDEPTSGLDPHSRRQMYETIDALKARGKTILVSTHALAEIEAHADKVVLIHRGRVLAAGSLADLRGNAQLPTLARLKLRTTLQENVLPQPGGGIEVRRLAPDRLTYTVPACGMPVFLDFLAEAKAQIDEVEILPPTLDRLYQHLLTQAELRQ